MSTTPAARWYRNPVYEGYFADPFVLRLEDHYVAYGTGSVVDGRVFEVLTSPDLVTWTRVGGALQPENQELGTDYWAPEVAETDGSFWLYYSQGFGDARHHLRVAHSESAYGPFVDAGVDLTPQELFAIDPHPFLDVDGTWYLFYARDVLDGERVGTQLAVDILPTMTSTAGLSQKVLGPTADWQISPPAARCMAGRTTGTPWKVPPSADATTGITACIREARTSVRATASRGRRRSIHWGLGWNRAPVPCSRPFRATSVGPDTTAW